MRLLNFKHKNENHDFIDFYIDKIGILCDSLNVA